MSEENSRQEEYIIESDIYVPARIKVKAFNEDEALEKALAHYEKKGVQKERIENLTWRLVKAKKRDN